MARRCVSARAFFRVAVAFVATPLLAGLVAGCAGTGAADADFDSDATAQGQERAEQWRSQGFAALAARQLEESALEAGNLGDRSREIECLLDAAECWLLDGRPIVAQVDVEKAQRVLPRLPPASSRERAAKFRIACARGDLAAVHGDAAHARDFYEEALGQALGRERDLATWRLSLLAEWTGDAKRARKLANELADPNDPRLAEVRRMLARSSATAKGANAPSPAATTGKAGANAKSAAPVVVASGPPVLPRTAWGARRSRSNLDRMSGIWRITVHHTATRLSGSSSRVAADAIKKFQREHQDEKGWADIGYHFIVDPSGRIWEGRPLAWQGAHAGSPDLNVGNIGIALIGDFTVQQPTPSQKKSLTDLLDSLCARYGVAPSHVFTHQEIRPEATECPGPALQRIVSTWRRGSTTTY